MKILKEPEVMYVIYARQIGSDELVSQQSSNDLSDAKHYLLNSQKYNDLNFKPGAGREYFLVKRVSTFEIVEE